ncbi:23S rRNA (guanine(2445)-N(2))-methyltransferase [hydrothermal vent metagenome]|uniref:23S rRNA (Guanine(2445)-N(2))-methyltransferase n=1 Tax=hydrothermal vent metagenome TaxID=652676 RepID=A0A3B1D4H9_9ZZZZ
MMKTTFIVTSTFGLEKIVKQELRSLGFHDFIVSDGKIEFQAFLEDIPKLNINLRTADRVLIKLAEFKATNFDHLFDETKLIPWAEWIPEDGKITVMGKSVKSTLESVRTNQSMVKKAIIEKLKENYKIEQFSESGLEFKILISILKDVAQITLDTSGDGLHKRAYRLKTGEVPLRENLAAALVLISTWTGEKCLIDPMCGSGTILIEAAMIAKNIAPGLKRKFISESWNKLDSETWSQARLGAQEAIHKNLNLKIFGYDIDPERIKDCKHNASNAGLENEIIFEQKDLKNLCLPNLGGTIISNPPYGIKLSDAKNLKNLYQSMNKLFKSSTYYDWYLLTGDKKFSRSFGAHPNKKRKLYNGTIETHYYQYYSERN